MSITISLAGAPFCENSGFRKFRNGNNCTIAKQAELGSEVGNAILATRLQSESLLARCLSTEESGGMRVGLRKKSNS
jgi:hypothetical protein